VKNICMPYRFDACRGKPSGNPAMNCGKEFNHDHMSNMLARVYVVSQKYLDTACPDYALRNGTFFNKLYMPYVPNSCMQNPCTRDGGGK